MRSTEHQIAGRIATKGLRAIEKIIDELDGLPRDDWSKTHVRDIADCVNAAVKVLAEERELEAFERAEEAAARKVTLPIGVQVDGRPMIDVMTDIYRLRLVAGDVTTTELARMTDQFLSIDHAKVALILKLLGPNVVGKSEEEIAALKEGVAWRFPQQVGQAERPVAATNAITCAAPSPATTVSSGPADCAPVDVSPVSEQPQPGGFIVAQDEGEDE